MNDSRNLDVSSHRNVVGTLDFLGSFGARRLVFTTFTIPFDPYDYGMLRTYYAIDGQSHAR